jgi:Tfp pilus assembly protein PilF
MASGFLLVSLNLPCFATDQIEQSQITFRDAIKLGQMHLFHGDLKAARSAFKIAITLNPDNIEGYLGLAKGYARSGDNRSAIEQYERALQIDSKRPDIYYAIGNLLLAEGDYTNAASNLSKAATSRSYHAVAQQALAKALSNSRPL